MKCYAAFENFATCFSHAVTFDSDWQNVPATMRVSYLQCRCYTCDLFI